MYMLSKELYSRTQQMWEEPTGNSFAISSSFREDLSEQRVADTKPLSPFSNLMIRPLFSILDTLTLSFEPSVREGTWTEIRFWQSLAWSVKAGFVEFGKV